MWRRAAEQALTHPMTARLATAALIVLLPYALTFLAVMISAGEVSEPVRTVVETEDERRAFRHHLGLDLPWLLRPGLWLAELVTGRFGWSRAQHLPALGLVLSAAPATLRLVAAALLISLAVGVPAGWLAALKPSTRTARAIMTATRILRAVPAYVAVIAGILIWTHATGRVPVPIPAVTPGEPWIIFLLAAIGLGLVHAGAVAGAVHAAVIDVLQARYLDAARVRGLPETRVLGRYALTSIRPALLNILRQSLAPILAASIMVEHAASIPGLGSLLVASVTTHDYPVITAWLAIVGATLALLGLGIELLQARFDRAFRRTS